MSLVVFWVWVPRRKPCIGLPPEAEGVLDAICLSRNGETLRFCLRVQGCPGKNKGQTLEHVYLYPATPFLGLFFTELLI